MAYRIDRSDYAAMFGPTTGDRVRLADTELIVEVEADHTIYGEEVKFGGGKVIRDGMGQSQVTRQDGAVDTVITNALIIDHWGIVKADIGIRDGRIAAIGKAGNPDVQPGVTIVVGPGTEVIAGEGKIVTAGGLDVHIHAICPQQAEEALYSGVTTLMGGGTGQRPASGSPASGVRAMGPALRAISAIPRARRRASGAMRSSTGRCTGSRTSCRLPSGGTSTSSPPRLAAVGVLPRGPNTTTSLRTRLSRRGSPRMRIPSPRLDSASVRAASARPFLLRQVTLPIYLS